MLFDLHLNTEGNAPVAVPLRRVMVFEAREGYTRVWFDKDSYIDVTESLKEIKRQKSFAEAPW